MAVEVLSADAGTLHPLHDNGTDPFPCVVMYVHAQKMLLNRAAAVCVLAVVRVRWCNKQHKRQRRRPAAAEKQVSVASSNGTAHTQKANTVMQGCSA